MPIESELVAREEFPASDFGAEAPERGVRESEKIHASVREVEVLLAERAQERVVQLCARERSAHGSSWTTGAARRTFRFPGARHPHLVPALQLAAPPLRVHRQPVRTEYALLDGRQTRHELRCHSLVSSQNARRLSAPFLLVARRNRSAHGLTTAGVRSTNASAISFRRVALGVSSKCRASHARRR
jgi:hypothetical protein